MAELVTLLLRRPLRPRATLAAASGAAVLRQRSTAAGTAAAALATIRGGLLAGSKRIAAGGLEALAVAQRPGLLEHRTIGGQGPAARAMGRGAGERIAYA